MWPDCRNLKLPFFPVLVLILASMVSCGNQTGTDGPSSAYQPGKEDLGHQTGSGAGRQIQPGIHESAGFFPVEPDAVPARFEIVGDMGGPVLYSSSTVPAWLVGTAAFMLGPDGRLISVDLEDASSHYIPPDLAVFSSHQTSTGAFNMDSMGQEGLESGLAADLDSHSSGFPICISVTGPASAVYLLDDHRLMSLSDDTLTVLRQFDSGFRGTVSISGSALEIVVADSSGMIQALDSTGDRILWESAGGPVLLSGGMAIFIGVDTHLQILEASGGRFVANSDLAGFSGSVKPARDGSTIFAVLRNGSLAAMDHSGKTRWIAETGMQVSWVMNDQTQVYAVSRDLLAAFDKATGSELWRLSIPVPPAGDPVILPGSIVFAGTNGKVYASIPDAMPDAPRAADPGERVSAIIGFRLEKYVRDRSEMLATFMPYVEQVAHEGPEAFTVFAFGPVAAGGEYWFTWDGQDRDVVLALFNERGDELRANLDEFGAHDSFSYRLDEGGRYFIALGRQDPSIDDEPLFLSVIPARRN
jgi:hypothetical protein